MPLMLSIKVMQQVKMFRAETLICYMKLVKGFNPEKGCYFRGIKCGLFITRKVGLEKLAAPLRY